MTVRAKGLCCGAAAMAAVALSISGCALSSMTDITATTPVRMSPAAQTRPAARSQEVDIRTVASPASREIAGAQCEAVSRDVTASFVSPARLRLPLYGANTAPLLVTCSHPLQGRATLSITPEATGGFFTMISGGLFGDNDPAAYEEVYRLELARTGGPAAAPPKPSSVSATPLKPIEGFPAPGE